MLPALGKPLLHWHLTRLVRSRRIDRLVVATTVEAQDDPIVDFCNASGVAVFSGSESDVLSRYAGAAAVFGAATIVRVTSDCPLIDPDLVDRVISAYGERLPSIDYLSLDVSDMPRGLDVEVFSAKALRTADAEAREPSEREHVTSFIYRRPDRYRAESLTLGQGLGGIRWCVDEAGDYELVRRIIETLVPANPCFTWRDCLAMMRAHPEWQALNGAVRQKPIL